MIAVFLGPTLPAAHAARELEATYLGPAAQGDIYRAARRGASAIGLVDGFFHSVPSVWHKEILWALSEGIPVYGSGSMGALRAAELWPYGMIGVGEVFEAYRDAVLTDDDEVALSHTDSVHGYVHASEPMVDIRATIERARREMVVDEATAAALVSAAKSLFYPDRNYPMVIEETRRVAPFDRLVAFEQWWPANCVSVKQTDAIAMLRRMSRDKAAGKTTLGRQFWFERTFLWDDLIRQSNDWDGRHMTRSGAVKEHAVALPDRSAGSTARDAALARVLALDEARRQQYRLDEDSMYQAVIQFRERRALLEPEDVERWMAENHLDKSGFLRIVADEARVEWVRAVLEPEIDAMLPDYLRVCGRFQALADPTNPSPGTCPDGDTR